MDYNYLGIGVLGYLYGVNDGTMVVMVNDALVLWESDGIRLLGVGGILLVVNRILFVVKIFLSGFVVRILFVVKSLPLEFVNDDA
jgi:hypothetical protein